MVLGNHLWATLLGQGGGLDQLTSKGPFQPQPFCEVPLAAVEFTTIGVINSKPRFNIVLFGTL